MRRNSSPCKPGKGRNRIRFADLRTFRPIGIVVLVAVSAAACASDAPDFTPIPMAAPTASEVYGNFSQLPDGPAPTTFSSGAPAHIAESIDPGSKPRIINGQLTFRPTGKNGPAAGYFQTDALERSVTRIGFRWIFSPATGKTPGIAAAAVTGELAHFIDGSSPVMPLHFIVERGGWNYSVAPERDKGGVELLSIASGAFNPPLAEDGKTIHSVEICVEKETATLSLPDGTEQTVRDPRIRAWASRFAFFEPFSSTGDPSSIAGFTEVWADSKPCRI